MIRIGIICPSNIAYRRFMPALKKRDGFEYVGVAYANSEEWFGGRAAPERIYRVIGLFMVKPSISIV